MNTRQEWQELQTLGTASADNSEFADKYEEFISRLLSRQEGSDSKDSAEADSARDAVLQAAVAVARGHVVEVGTLAQVEIVFLAALYHVAQGRRALILSPMPIEATSCLQLVQFMMTQLGLSVGIMDVRVREAEDRARQQPKPAPPRSASGSGFQADMDATVTNRNSEPVRPRVDFDADIVLCDYPRFVATWNRQRDLLGARPTAALFCETDLCLYDCRLSFFAESNSLRGMGGFYRTTVREGPWRSTKGIVDIAEILPEFATCAGVTSYMPKIVEDELQHAQTPALGKLVRRVRARTITPLVFETREDKYRVMAEDLVAAENDVLVFYAQDSTMNGLGKELRQRGQGTLPLASVEALSTFLAKPRPGKRVGFFPGFPNNLELRVREPRPVSIVIGELYPLPHHHDKILAFAEQSVAPDGALALYVSLEDEIISAYAEDQNFDSSFRLVNLAEKWRLSERLQKVLPRSLRGPENRRWVRSRVAASLLKRVQHLLWRNMTEAAPLLRISYPTTKKGSTKKDIGSHLGGLCFCGSGKPFRECHGKMQE